MPLGQWLSIGSPVTEMLDALDARGTAIPVPVPCFIEYHAPAAKTITADYRRLPAAGSAGTQGWGCG